MKMVERAEETAIYTSERKSRLHQQQINFNMNQYK